MLRQPGSLDGQYPTCDFFSKIILEQTEVPSTCQPLHCHEETCDGCLGTHHIQYDGNFKLRELSFPTIAEYAVTPTSNAHKSPRNKDLVQIAFPYNT